MGQQMTTNKHKLPKGEEITRNRFEFQNIIGKGGFGKVWKVLDKRQKMHYALKEMAKLKVIDKKSEKSIKYERELLCHLKHPFIVNMYYAFQDYDNLYLVMDLLTGGDLRYHICKQRRFSEDQTRLEYIHGKNVIHRDIKPENLVLDEKGYVRITDFGIAKVFSSKNSMETSGTPGYMSPEVMKGQNHTHAVDYFALGVMGYEFMLGYRPYQGKNRKEIKDQMMTKQAQIKYDEKPGEWSDDSIDFINKLLMRKPEMRLGTKSSFEVKNHPWLRNFPWKDLYNKTYKAPFIPERRDNYDKRYCNSIDKLGIDTKSRYEEYCQKNNFNNLFENFTYYPILDNECKEDKNDHKEVAEEKIVRKDSLHTGKSKSNLVQYYNRHCLKQSSSIEDFGFRNSLNKQEQSYLYPYKNNLNPPQNPNVSSLLGNNHNKSNSISNSKSISNFRSYPIKKSSTINLSQSKNLLSSSSSTNILSNGNNGHNMSNINNKTSKIQKSQMRDYNEGDHNNNSCNINMIYQKNYVYYNKKNYIRDKTTSCSVIKRIRSPNQHNLLNSNIDNNIKEIVTGAQQKSPSLQRSLSSYGFSYSKSKPLLECDINDIKVIDASKSSKKDGSNSSYAIPSTTTNKISYNHNDLKHCNSSNTVNILLKNYKISCNSINSTGSSLLSNPNVHANSNINANTNTNVDNAINNHA